MTSRRARPASLEGLETFVSPAVHGDIVNLAELGDPEPRTARERSEAVLAEIGLPVERGPDVGLIMRLLSGCSTRGGWPRQVRLEHCGVAYPVLVDDELVWTRQGCKDRFCPECQDRAGRQLARKVQGHCERRQRVILGVNLTQLKEAREEPKAAVDRMLTSWRAMATGRVAAGLFRSARSRSKNPTPAVLPGGIRCLEITAHPAGTLIGQRLVSIGGIHAHIHALAEVQPGADLEEVEGRIKAAWIEASPGAAAECQVIKPLAGADLIRAIVYALNLGALARLVDVAAVYARAVVETVAGRKLIEPWGTWRGKFCGECGTCGTCRRVGVKREQRVKFGDRSLANVVLNPHGVVRFGDTVWQASDVAALLLSRPKMWPASE